MALKGEARMPRHSHDARTESQVAADVVHDTAFSVPFVHRLRFTRNVFDAANHVLADVLGEPANGPHRLLVCLDEGVAGAWPRLPQRIAGYMRAHRDRMALAAEVLIVRGGEAAKNDRRVFEAVIEAIHRARICRQSFVLVIGGGAVLDAVGFAAAAAHRGVRLVRLPTTTLAQDDSGVGVKNSINAFGKKNFLGSFSPPWAIINDELFLTTLAARDWRSGFSEAVKISLVRDAAFFEHIEKAAPQLARGKIDAAALSAARPVIRRSAELHARHIVAGDDAFELTEARPLDFGHWSAHMLEQMTDFELRHGEAVAIGIAIDVVYSSLMQMLQPAEADRVIACLESLGFALHHVALRRPYRLLDGLEEFREHLGGPLTITLLEGIGRPVDVHEIDRTRMIEAIETLQARASSSPRLLHCAG